MAIDSHYEETEGSFVGEAPAPLAPGVRIHQYELIRELGRGGMGVVFAARDLVLGRRVAIKFVLQASGEVAVRFMNEARALASCEHPNIVIIHAVDEHDGLPYLVLEFLEGHLLRDLIAQTGRLPASRVVEVILPVARALARTHEVGIIHRDLKPENVFLTSAGQVKVLDFGIAKALDEERSSSQRLTAKHSLLGTMTYMSPEQMGTDTVDAASDTWALGIMMFEMLAGRYPVEPATTEALIENAVSDEPMISLAAVAPDVPPDLVHIVDRCLLRDRRERPSCAELARALEALAPGRRVRTLAEDESPFPGLLAFQEADAGRFFGRDAEIAKMVARVREHPMSGVIGPSGAGKSSFVRAGVVPALKASGERWEAISMRPGRQPLAAIAAVLHRATTPVGRDATTQGSTREQLVRRLRGEPGHLGSLLRAHAQRTSQNVLLYVDQLEELFTLTSDPTERAAFASALAGAADDPAAPVRVVISMRADFVDRLVEHQGFVEEISRSILLLSTPDRNGLRLALEQPLEQAGYGFERDDIVTDMLAALEGVSGALPLLQFAAAKLWDGRDRHRKLITLAGYHAIGGISGALATHADDVMAQLDSSAQRLARRLFRALVTPERTRAIVELGDLYALLGDRGEAARVVDQLAAARLVVVQKRGDATGGGTAELVHESLIDRWPTLRRWIDEDHEDAAYMAQIAAASKQWETRGRPVGLLWRGDAMQEAKRWLAARPREVSARDRAFLDAVLALGERGVRRRRRAVISGFIVLGALAGAGAAATLAINRARQDALESSHAAEHAADLWKQAASERDAKERERKEAEARGAEAEREASDATARAERERREAEASRLAAEQASAQAASQVKAKESEVVESREALQQKNRELEASLRDQRTATERAERATADAQRAQAEAQRAQAEAQKAFAEAQRNKAELEKALEAERKRIKALEDERRKLSTQLKE